MLRMLINDEFEGIKREAAMPDQGTIPQFA
jgi:hypothetical protein